MDKKVSDKELAERLTEAARQVPINAVYRHYKGNYYRVIDVALLEETAEGAVVYQALYGEGVKFIRPLEDWRQTVEWQGKTVNRFSLAEE